MLPFPFLLLIGAVAGAVAGVVILFWTKLLCEHTRYQTWNLKRGIQQEQILPWKITCNVYYFNCTIRVSWREAVVYASQYDGQGYIRCNCSWSRKINVKQTDVKFNASKQSSNVIVDATKFSTAKTNEIMLISILYVPGSYQFFFLVYLIFF